ncbi:PDR/VanB family oxidoreductase [Aeromicrobium sp. CF4.19]|uniref:PDR/VanB family oxidoreductase n=1 Tax=Aeromicrobium sp. CF4.19 TaxID=3373082 RepID=UPI003EE4FE96
MSVTRQDVQVVAVHRVADDVVHLVLEPTGPHSLEPWSPGAHIDVEIQPGLVRQYSLCGASGDTDAYEIAVLHSRDGRGGSTGVHRLKAGAHLRISAPRNDFELRESGRYLFVAGGIGITPLLPMIEMAAARGADWTLVYGGRSRTSMAFVDPLLERHGDQVRIVTEDVDGLIDVEGLLSKAESETLVYCCGPEGLLAAVESTCADRWPVDSLVVERFGSRPDSEASEASGDRAAGPGPAEQPEDGVVEVQLGCGGPVIDVPGDQPILTALIDAGVDIFYSCQEGICGSCETTVLEGEPDHRDDLLTPMDHQQGAMLVCVSRARSRRLVLDVDPP